MAACSLIVRTAGVMPVCRSSIRAARYSVLASSRSRMESRYDTSVFSVPGHGYQAVRSGWSYRRGGLPDNVISMPDNVISKILLNELDAGRSGHYQALLCCGFLQATAQIIVNGQPVIMQQIRINLCLYTELTVVC